MPHTAAFISVKAMDGVNAREFSFGSSTAERLASPRGSSTFSTGHRARHR